MSGAETAEAVRFDPRGETDRSVRKLWNQVGYFALLGCLLGAGLYCVLRINRVEGHRFFGARIDPALNITGSNRPAIFETTGFVRQGERIAAVDGDATSNLREFRSKLRGTHHTPFTLELLSNETGQTREVIFWDALRLPALRGDEQGHLEWEGTLPALLESRLAGARVLRVGGSEFKPGMLSTAYREHPWWLQFTIEAPETAQPVSVLFWKSDYRSPWVLLLVGVCFGGLGLTVYRMHARTRSSRAFLGFSMAAALFFLSRSIPGHFRMEWERQVFGLILVTLFVASIHFAGTFTSLRAVYTRRISSLRFLVLVGLAAVTAWSLLDLPTFLKLWSAGLLIMLAAVLLSPWLLAASRMPVSHEDIQRNRLTALALALAFGPPLVFLLLEMSIEKGFVSRISESQLPSRFWFDLPAVFFPLLIGYAVIRRNLLQVNELLVEGATYGLLGLGMGGVFATFVGLAVPLVEQFRPGSSVFVTGIGAGLVAWVSYPIFMESRRRLEERFQQSLRAYDSLATRVAMLGEAASDRLEFCRTLAPSLRELTKASTVSIMLPDRFAAEPILSGGADVRLERAEADRHWRRIFESEQDLPRELQREELIDSARNEPETWELLDALDALKLLFVFPLVSEGIIQGLVGVSGKVDHRNYSRAEVQKLRLVARECALALYGFTIRENMRARRRAEENLRKSEEKLRESQKLEAVATLAGGIAHDFHNLITAIFSFTSVAKETLPFDHPAADAVSNVEEAARQASGITKSLLVFTRKSRSERRPVDLSQFLPRAVRFVQGILPRDVGLSCEVETAGPFWIEADESQLHQVIMNLVVNARDAMPEGGEIRIRMSRIDSWDSAGPGSIGRILIEVADTGGGMTEEVRRRAFEPFFTTKHRDRGTGLGLSIVRGIVRDNGGVIDLESAPGTGTRVELVFPACQAEAGESTEFDVCERGRARKGRVLVIDADRMVRFGLATCLRQDGFEVLQASGVDDLDEVVGDGRNDIGLIVLDPDATELDGMDFLEALAGRGISAPVLLITGDPLGRLKESSYPDVTVLSKPFGIPGFVQAVNGKFTSNTGVERGREGLVIQ
jgi:signal transduction histidine kinase